MSCSVSSSLLSCMPTELKGLLPNEKILFKVSQTLSEKAFIACSSLESLDCRVEILPTDPEYAFLLAYFNHQRPPGMRITSLSYIFNPVLNKKFENEINLIETETTPLVLSWQNKPYAQQRQAVIKRWKIQVGQFSPCYREMGDRLEILKNTKILPLWQSMSELRDRTTHDFIYFGKHHLGEGFCFTNSARYAAIHAKGLLLLSWVAMREPYPMISDIPKGKSQDFIKLDGLESYRNYKTFFLPLTPSHPYDHTQTNYVPCIAGQEPVFDEFIVFNKSQVLPSFCLEYGPSLLREPSSMLVGEEALFVACYKGDLPFLKNWIHNDPSQLDLRGNNNESLLYIAARGGQIEVMEWLNSQNSSLLDITTTFRAPPLYAAILEGHQTAAEWIFSRRSHQIYTVTADEWNLMHLTACSGTKDTLLWLMDKAPDLIKMTTGVGWTSFHVAAMAGKIPILDCLLHHSKTKTMAQVKAQDGSSLLHVAAFWDQKETVQWLDRQIPNLVNEVCLNGQSPAHWAAAGNSVAVLQWLQEKDPSLLTQKDHLGQWAIHLAAQSGKKESVVFLISHLKARDNKGRTPLHSATIQGQKGVVSLLIHHGADPFERTSRGENCFHLCAEQGHLDLLHYLLQSTRHRSDCLEALYQVDTLGNTPLHQAVCLHPKTEIVRELLIAQVFFEDAVNSDPLNSDQCTPLHYAARQGHLESAKLLVSMGAAVRALNANEQTPLDLALQEGHDEVSRFLVDPEHFLSTPLLEELPDPESYYFDCFETAYRWFDNVFEQVFYLEKISQCYLLKKNYLKAAQLLNSALAAAVRYKLNDLYQKRFLVMLENIEQKYLWEVHQIKIPLSYHGSIFRYRERLAFIRSECQDLINTYESIDNIQKSLSKEFQNVLVSLIEESILLLGSPPTPYAFLSLGSMARGEMAPYSDAEFAILIRDSHSNHKTYFRHLANLLELKITNLGETPFNIIRPNLALLKETWGQSFIPHGFSMDSGGLSPLGKSGIYELIGTPQELASFQTEEWLLRNDGEVILVNAMANPSWITGELNLVNEYKIHVNHLLAKKLTSSFFGYSKGTEYRKKIALKIIIGHLSEFKPWLTEERLKIRAFDVKKDLYRPIQMIIEGLALYYQLTELTTIGRIQELKDRGLISSQGADQLKAAITSALKLRIRLQLYYQEQKEIMLQPNQPSVEEIKSLIQRDRENAIVFIPLKLPSYFPQQAKIDPDLSSLEEKNSSIQFSEDGLLETSQMLDSSLEEEDWKKASKQENDATVQPRFIITTKESELLTQLYDILIPFHRAMISFANGDQSALQKFNHHHSKIDTFGLEAEKTFNYHIAENAYIQKLALTYEIETLIDVGRIKWKLGEPLKAIQLYQEAYVNLSYEVELASLDAESEEDGMIKYLWLKYQLLLLLGQAYQSLDTPKDLDTALHYHLEAQEECLTLLLRRRELTKQERQKIKHDRVLLEINISHSYIKKGEAVCALLRLQKFLDDHWPLNLDKKKYSLDKAAVLRALGAGYSAIGNLHSALTSHKKSLEMCEQFFGKKPHLDYALTLNQVGMAYKDLCQLPKALDCLKKSESMRKKIEEEKCNPHFAQLWNNFGEVFEDLGQFHMAKNYFEKSLEIYRQIYEDHPHHQKITPLQNLGRVSQELNQTKLAIHYYKRALTIAQQLSSKKLSPLIADAMNQLGYAYFRAGRNRLALDYYLQALILFETCEHDDYQIDFKYTKQLEIQAANCLTHISLVFQTLGQSIRSLEYSSEAVALNIDYNSQSRENWFKCIMEEAKNSKNAEDILVFEELIEEYHIQPEMITATNNFALCASNEKSEEALNSAIKNFQLSQQWCQEVYQGFSHKNTAVSFNGLGKAFFLLGQHEKAIEHYLNALKIQKDVSGKWPHPFSAEILNNIGEAYLAIGSAGQAITCHKKALNIYEKVYQEQSHPHCERTRNLLRSAYTTSYHVLSKYQARRHWSSMSFKPIKSDRCFESAISLNYESKRLKASEGKFQQAINLYREALAIEQQIYDSWPGARMSKGMNTIKELRWGPIQQATEYLHQSVSLNNLIFGDQPNRQKARSLDNLGSAYYLGENISCAIDFYLQALAMREKIYSDEPHHEIASSLLNLAEAYSNNGEVQIALDYFKRALCMQKRIYCDRPHSDIASILYQIAGIYNNLGEIQLAIDYYHEVLQMEQGIYQERPHVDIASLLNDLGNAYSRLGKIQEALEYYQRAGIIEQQLWENKPHPNRVACLNHQARSYEKLAKFEEAIKLRHQSLEMLHQIYPSKLHLSTATALNNLGVTYLNLNQGKKAVRFLKRASKIHFKLMLKDDICIHPSKYMITCNNLAMAYQNLGNNKKAKEYFENVQKLIQTGTTGNI